MPLKYYKVETDREDLAKDWMRRLALSFDAQSVSIERDLPPLQIWQVQKEIIEDKRLGLFKVFKLANIDTVLEVNDEDIPSIRQSFRDMCCRLLEEGEVTGARFRFTVSSGDSEDRDYLYKQIKLKRKEMGEGVDLDLGKDYKFYDVKKGFIFRAEYRYDFYQVVGSIDGPPELVCKLRKFIIDESKRHRLQFDKDQLIFDHE